MAIKIKCPDGEIRTPEECLETEKSIPYPLLKKILEGSLRKRKKKDRIRFGVTKIATKCLRQSFYQMTEDQVLELEKLWILSRGHAFHNHFKFEKDEFFIERKFKDFDILGFIDGIEGDVMYELKTTNTIPSQPQDHHTLQLQAYYSMYPDKDQINKLKIVYLNLSTIKTFEIPKRDISPWIESRSHQLVTALQTKIPPPKEKSWLCSYCPFENICENHTVEKKETVKKAVDKIVKNRKELKKMESWQELFNNS